MALALMEVVEPPYKYQTSGSPGRGNRMGRFLSFLVFHQDQMIVETGKSLKFLVRQR